MQKNLIFSFSYLATVGKYTENPYGRKRQERDSDLYDISAERKNERQQNVFFNRCKLLISRGVNSATRIIKTVQTGKVSIKYSQKWSQRALQTSLPKLDFFFYQTSRKFASLQEILLSKENWEFCKETTSSRKCRSYSVRFLAAEFSVGRYNFLTKKREIRAWRPFING